jgi:hypothetical protein
MYQRLLNAASRFVGAAVKVGSAVANAWRTLVAASAYQPELHYMRGPGPKWRQKHAPVARPSVAPIRIRP